MGIKLKIKSLMHLIRIIVTELEGLVSTDEYRGKLTVESNDIGSEDKFFGFNHISRIIYGIIVSRGVLW